MPVRNVALMTKDEAHSIKELVDIKFQRLGEFQVVAVEVDIVGEVVHRRNHAAVTVESPL